MGRTALRWVQVECDDPEIEILGFEAAGFADQLVRKLGRHGGRLPDDERALAGILHCDIRVFRRLWQKVKHLFVIVQGWVRHRLVDAAFERLASAPLPPHFGRKCHGNPLKTKEPVQQQKEDTDSERSDDLSFGARGAENRAQPGSPKVGEVREEEPDAPPRHRDAERQPERPPRPRHHRTTPKTAITDWCPGRSEIAFAQEKGFDDRHIRFVAERFFNHHVALDSRFANWPAAWRGYVLGAVERRERQREPVDWAERAQQRGREATASIYRVLFGDGAAAPDHGGWTEPVAATVSAA